MDPIAEALKERALRFALKVLDFVETTPRSQAGQSVSGQLIRAGCGVVGNYRSACRARSHAEFTARIGVVVDEADESELWLDISEKKGWGQQPLRRELLDESRQLRAVFARTYSTARSKDPRRR